MAPDAPFLFFRGVRGDFEWISFGDAGRWIEGTHAPARALPVDVEDWLRTVASGAPAGVGGDAARLPPGPERDIWISWRPLADEAEAALARWAVARGVAVVIERHAEFPFALFEWVRPTIVSAPITTLEALADRLEGAAPRRFRGRWWRRRAGRLRRLLVEGAASGERMEALRVRLDLLSPRADRRVEPFDPNAGVALV